MDVETSPGTKDGSCNGQELDSRLRGNDEQKSGNESKRIHV